MQFEKECKILNELEHRNIVHFFGSCTSPSLIMIFEVMMGGTLFSALHQNKTTTKDKKWKVGLLSQVADAMAYLHSRYVAHLDLK
jgi:serine/threonine protein kinase